jgi:hypothetical protein
VAATFLCTLRATGCFLLLLLWSSLVRSQYVSFFFFLTLYAPRDLPFFFSMFSSSSEQLRKAESAALAAASASGDASESKSAAPPAAAAASASASASGAPAWGASAPSDPSSAELFSEAEAFSLLDQVLGVPLSEQDFTEMEQAAARAKADALAAVNAAPRKGSGKKAGGGDVAMPAPTAASAGAAAVALLDAASGGGSSSATECLSPPSSSSPPTSSSTAASIEHAWKLPVALSDGATDSAMEPFRGTYFECVL